MRHSNLTFLVLLVALVGCGKTLDTTKIEEDIKTGIVQQGGTSTKSVVCPNNVPPEAGRNFECTGILDSGAGFTIAIKQQDNQGNIFWEAPSVKGLLNMAQLQTEFEQGLKKELGQASIDCGSAKAYRSVKPGETFECQLLKRDVANKDGNGKESTDSKEIDNKSDTTGNSAKTPAKPSDIIQVTIQPSGDINWQRVIKVADSKRATSTASTETPKTETPKLETPDLQPTSNTPTPPAAKSPEDFLNQPGAADDFN